MDEKFLAWNLDINDALTATITGQVVSVALFVAGICIICSVAWNFLTTGFGKLVGGDGSDSFPNYQELARCFVLVLCISAYMPIAQTIVGTIETVNQMTASKSLDNIANFYNLQKENTVADIQDGNVEKNTDGTAKTTFGKVKDYVSNAVEKGMDIMDETTDGMSKVVRDIGTLTTVMNPINLGPILIHVVVNVLVMIIKIVVQGVAVLMTKVLVILGPLAFAFSILPVFRKQLEQWFSTLVTCGMTLTTINILDAIINAVTGHLFANFTSIQILDIDNIAGGKNIEIIAFDIVIIILYCSAFWLTSKYVGKGDAGRVLSKAVTLATTMAAIAVTGGAGGASGGGANVTGAANTAKKVIDEE